MKNQSTINACGRRVYRAAVWTSADGQSEVRLTGEEQSAFADEDLIAAAELEVAKVGLDISTGDIIIQDWTE